MVRSASIDINVNIECALDEGYFGDWNDLALPIKAYWQEEHRQPNCAGSGQMGTICKHCPFCQQYNEEQV